MGKGSGRRHHSKTDVLRAAVVLLHAAMEDLLRSIAYWKLPSASSEVLSGIPLVSKTPAIKFTLGDLVAFRGQGVDEIIQSSVEGFLERSNYNNTTDISSLLINVGIDVTKVNPYYPALDLVMSRRHQIVHRADRDDKAAGKGKHNITSIGVNTVEKWATEVKAFGDSVLAEL